MICKSLTYLDFNNEVHTDDFYFHLKQDEIVEMEFSQKGGLGTYLEVMMKSENRGEIIKTMKSFLSTAYGVRYGEKNEKFTKDPAVIREFGKPTPTEFLESNAYTVLFMELVTNEQAMIEFILGVVPAELAAGLDMDAIKAAAEGQVKGKIVDVPLPQQNLLVPPMEELRMPTVTENAGYVGAENIPAAFRRPPADEARGLPKLFETMTREEVLEAYDQQMAKRRDDSSPEPPAA